MKIFLFLFIASATNSFPLDLNVTDTYDPLRARVFLQFSKSAYCDASAISAWDCVPCQSLTKDYKDNVKVFTDSKTEGQAFVGSSVAENSIVIAFRGSCNLPNWITNLNYTKKSEYPKCSGCEVHGGFYAAWLALQDGIVADVLARKKAMPGARIFVTGHSLGAALAVLAAAELHYSHSLSIEAVYTFGEPRTGNSAFASFYNQGTHISWRVTHNRDPVPHVPLHIMGFQHIATEVFYNEDSSSYVVCNGSGEDSSCSDHFDLDTKIDDHLHYLGISTDCN
eukprot:CAMPEP_0175154326 /NCGR_PEP_ID=MMETSP0087-20121206/20269_1 /TAXON_ID=136419 /ORGANISM="Unknown Unknown, Strain D1" /LENGTH=280 /DNA_ID=CAMNT_0016441181 /DNA_START=32 /DNA_END=874 /DNA_ORIENTATION=-